MKVKNFIILIGLAVGLNLINSHRTLGETGMAFLKIGAGARAAGLAEAVTASVDDATATYWNPAGLAQIKNTEIIFSHNRWIQDINHEFFAIAFRTGKMHWGFSLNSMNVGEIERRFKPTEEPIGTFAAHDIALGLSLARQVSNSLRIGLTGKYIYERIYIESAPGLAVDFGLNYQPTFLDGLQVGAVVQNLGFTSKLKNESIKLPQIFRAGLAYGTPSFIGNRVLGAIDVIQVLDGDFHLNTGIEWRVREGFALRVGYQTGWEEKGLHTGLGIHLSRYAVDYAYTPFTANLGNSHRFTFRLSL